MPPLINTASEVGHISLAPARDAIDKGSSYSSLILFPNNDEKYHFTISPGQMAVLTGYNLDEAGIDIYKILINSGTDQVGGGPCCEPSKKATPARVALRSKICAWKLVDCSPIVVIKIPGIYEVMPEDPNSEATVTLDRYPLQDVNNEINSST